MGTRPDHRRDEGPPLKVVVAGHVDHGKSTLIGRLLHETDSLPEGKLAELTAMSERRGVPFEWSFVLDAFQAERDQAVTIDTTQIWFRSASRRYVIIDAPGHREFLRNMISGAASADAALLVVDVRQGVREQSRRHAYLLHLLGLREVAVVVNKMDTAGFSAGRFAAVAAEIGATLGGLGLAPVAVVPVSARDGVNLIRRSDLTPWYQGPTVVEALDAFPRPRPPVDRPLRLPVQDVYRWGDRRIIVGRVETGVLRVGDRVLFSPSDRTARIRAVEGWGAAVPREEIGAGRVVGFTLDEDVFVERGEVASHTAEPPKLSNVFRATVFWLGRASLSAGATLTLKLATSEARVTVETIVRVIDTETLEARGADAVAPDEVAEVVLRASRLLAVDDGPLCPATARCVLVDTYDTVGGGIISMTGYPDQRQLAVKSANLHEVAHLLTPAARAWRHGHYGAVVWFTGLSGAGKSTLAMRLEQRLFNRGFQTYVLDGDNIRRGLNSDLGFSPEDRAENIRRVGEAAALFADAGLVVITAFISPYRADRARARAAAPQAFHEVYIKADLATCEERDPKGLYRRARAGEIPEFTGVSAPYEPPDAPELVVDTTTAGVERCVEELLAYVERHVAVRRGRTGRSGGR